MPRLASWTPLLRSFPDSRKINSVSEGAEVLYLRLLALSDDAGGYYADPEIVRAKAFSFRLRNVSVRDVSDRLNELFRVRLAVRFEVGGIPYLRLESVEKGLRPDVKPKIAFPDPKEADSGPSVPDAERDVPDAEANVPLSLSQSLSQSPSPTQGRARARPPVADPLEDALRDPRCAELQGSPAFVEAMREWLADRRARKLKAYTPLGLQKQLTALAELGPLRAAAAIEHSIRNQYQGIHEPKEATRNGPDQLFQDPRAKRPDGTRRGEYPAEAPPSIRTL